MAYQLPGGSTRRPRRPRPVTPLRRPPASKPPAAPQIHQLIQAAQATMKPYGRSSGFDPSAEVGAELDPLIQYTANKYNQMALDERSRLGGLTNQYASALEGIAGQTHGIYQGPIRTLGDVSEGVSGHIRQAGEGAGASLSGALSQAGLPANAGGSDINLGAMGAGSSEAAYALGQAMVQALRQEQAAAEKYTGQLPGFARQEGDARTNDALTALSKELADQIAEYTAQAPGLYRDLVNEQSDRERQRQQDYYSAYGTPFEQRQYADAQAAKRAGIVSPQAPTTQGRLGYWQGVAADRTKNSGIEWQGTTTGIRPVDSDPRKPGIQPTYTLQGAAAAQAGIKTRAGISNDRKRTKIAQQNADTSSTRAGIAQQNADTSSSSATERARHNRATEAQAKAKAAKQPKSKLGSAPRRAAPGRWVDRHGNPLSPKASQIWERKWRNGQTDGKGHVSPPDKSSSSSSSPSGTIRKKTP